VIRKFRPDSFKKGNLKNLDGKVIGVHDGIINFTIGQRKGIKISDKEPLYVLKINADNNEIIVGIKENLAKKEILLNNLNLLTLKKDLKQNIFVKVRSTGKLLEAKVNLQNNNKAHVNLIKPEDGISPGQACVFYNKDQFGYKVLGGGWIVS
jgi:tRNA-specific 2-thiouridylase